MGESRGNSVMSGTVTALKLQKNRGEVFLEAEYLILDTGKGILGDCHYGGGKGQVCILDEECRRWMEEEAGEGLCFSRFQENILIDGSPAEWEPGVCLGIGETVLEITQKGKRCFAECVRVREKKPCRLRESCCFAAVRQGGKIGRGDSACILR